MRGLTHRPVVQILLIILTVAAAYVTPELHAQTPGVLRIAVVVANAEQNGAPVARYALLISDNPATEAPRRVVTGTDGSVTVRLPPGNYTVESDEPFVVGDKAYVWTQTLDIGGGANVVLELTERNAEIGARDDTTPSAANTRPRLMSWKASVVSLWTSRTRISGLLIDARGLVATSRRAIGDASSVDVQLSPSLKVEGRVLASDAKRDVAIVWIDPTAAATRQAAALVCGPSAPSMAEDQTIVAVGVPLRPREDGLVHGRVSRVAGSAVDLDMRLVPGIVGGPLVTVDGDLIGLTSFSDENDSRRRAWRAVPLTVACEAALSAKQQLETAIPPARLPRPVEPTTPVPVAALEDAAARRASGLNPYRVAGSEFDIAFITPVMVYAAQQPNRRTNSADTRRGPDDRRIPHWSDFDGWSDYVAEVPSVLLVRVTPRLAEGFWTTVARGAAMTQGVNLPAVKRFKAPLSRMRAFCGNAEIAPIHALTLESHVVDNEAVVEGLFVFDPGAFGPHCKDVKLQLLADTDAARGDTRVVDPAIVQQVWEDFGAYRAP